jgi:hypothetical protein
MRYFALEFLFAVIMIGDCVQSVAKTSSREYIVLIFALPSRLKLFGHTICKRPGSVDK